MHEVKSAVDRTRSRFTPWRVLVFGAVLYVVGLAVLVFTGNPNVFPTVVMIGSFLVPVAYVAFFHHRGHFSPLNVPRTALSFLYGGILGTLAAAVIEPLVVQRFSLGNAFLIGVIEEAAKIIGIMIIARRREHHLEIDGFILGAAAGMGFAAFESTGYAFTAFISSQGSLSATVGVTLLRGVLSPLGHGTWTAILASVLFRESGDRALTINLRVLGAFLLVVVLHALWDALPPLVTILFGPGIDVVIAQAAVGIGGLVVLWLRWREARRQLAAESAEAAAVGAAPPPDSADQDGATE